MQKKSILIDSYGFIFRAYHVQPPLTSPEGKNVGAIYGFTSMLIKLLQEHKPTHIVAVFDSAGKNFRHEIYSEYKSHRPELDQDLKDQFPLMREVTKALNLISIEKPGFEADDIIATLAKSISNTGEEVIIVSGDKDLAQLMSDKIKIFDPVKSKFITEEDIFLKFGVNQPSKIRDVLALIGDKSDNIPGVPGFGPKTASELISEFGSFDNLTTKFEQIKSERKRTLFQEHIEKAKLSYELVALNSDVSLDINIQEIAWTQPSLEQIIGFLNHYGFKSLIARASKIAQQEQTQFSFDVAADLVKSQKQAEEISSDISKLKEEADISGYISIIYSQDSFLLESNEKIFEILDLSEIGDLLEKDSILKILFNIKSYNKKFKIISYADISIISYILSSGKKQLELTELLSSELGIAASNQLEIISNLRKLYLKLYNELFKEQLLPLYIDIDYPISIILDKIERTGVKFNVQDLNNLSGEFGIIISELEEKIYNIAGRDFNIASPKQLGEVLFNDLKLPATVKNSKSEGYSTNVEILEELSLKGYEIADHLLKWRQISKLKNTYTDAIPKLVNSETGRIHTTLLQTSTATGRLSSLEPNLQNIPIRTKEGAKIRAAMIASPACKLISADYSQIELRILAEIANIKDLKEAFVNNQDVHSKTASEIFHVPIAQISDDQRRKAKAINFGIIYGISSFGLAKQLNISRLEAKEYIERYFQKYPGIKEYMDRTIGFARENGFVLNYFGRKCFLPSITSTSHSMKNFAERAAINAPIQGAAADIVKIAMIEIDKMLSTQNFKTKLTLQIHDELLFECPDSELEQVVPFIKKIMENIVPFETKLKVDIHISSFWS